MSAALQKRGVQPKAGHARARVILVGGTFIALLAVAAVARHSFSAKPPTPAADGQYRGVVQYAPGHGGACERYEFDNQSGLMLPQAGPGCDTTAGVAARSTELTGQLSGVRDYFKPR
jgi:hypothetical protein